MAKKTKKDQNIKKTSISVKDLQSNDKVIHGKIETIDIKKLKKMDKSDKKEIIETQKYLVMKSVSSLLLDIQKATKVKDVKDIKEKIGNLLTVHNNSEFKNAYSILRSQNELGITDLEGGMYKESSYIGYVFFFWNIKHMNFRIIGLTEITPLFELKETNELYYLHIPTMSNKGIPIFWLTKGISLSIELEVSEQMDSVINDFRIKGYSPDVIRAMLDSPQFIRIYGKQRISARFIVMVILIMIIEGFAIYTVMSQFIGRG